ncbi:MAG TPA: TonB C-terminal domain-containing protein [Deltaproteobacteria bacterium]|nr:TonB C-terminal domain-containing protein [Deltaproteobacteria bacterium]
MAFILAMVEIHVTGRKLDPTSVYEVSIVAGPPSARAGQPAGVSTGRVKKYVFTRSQKAATFGEVRKEREGRDQVPEFSPADIRPESPGMTQDMPDAADLIRGQARDAAGASQGPAGAGVSSEILIWKTRVRGMVESLWRTPPEIETMDHGLKTTYLLRVGRAGELLQKKLLVSSGNVPFDRSILAALGKVTRFPVPPLALIAGEDWVEVTISFMPPKGAK